MKVTAGSTALDDQNRARRLPLDLLARTNAALDDLDQLRGEKAAQANRGKTAGQIKANRTRRAIIAMVWRHRRQLRAWTPGKRESRAIHIQNYINGAIALSDSDPKMWMGITRPPHWRTIDRVIHSLRM